VQSADQRAPILGYDVVCVQPPHEQRKDGRDVLSDCQRLPRDEDEEDVVKRVSTCFQCAVGWLLTLLVMGWSSPDLPHSRRTGTRVRAGTPRRGITGRRTSGWSLGNLHTTASWDETTSALVSVSWFGTMGRGRGGVLKSLNSLPGSPASLL
jgi:hypothetical protein